MTCPGPSKRDPPLTVTRLEDGTESDSTDLHSSGSFEESPPSMVMEFMDSPVGGPEDPKPVKAIKRESSMRIVVTTPLSPKERLTEDHPYTAHKQRHQILIDGFIRIHSDSKLGLINLALNTTVLSYFYFHFADTQSQQSTVLGNKFMYISLIPLYNYIDHCIHKFSWPAGMDSYPTAFPRCPEE